MIESILHATLANLCHSGPASQRWQGSKRVSPCSLLAALLLVQVEEIERVAVGLRFVLPYLLAFSQAG